MTTPAAVDKLVLHAKRDTFRVRDLHGGLWAPTQAVHMPIGPDAKELAPWHVDAKGTPIYGSLKASVPIGDTIIHLAVNGNGAKVTTNPDKWHHAWQPTATAAKLPEVRKVLHEVIGKYIDVDVDGMATQHVDLCRQATMSDHTQRYEAAARTCPPPRKELFPEPGGFRIGTATQAVQTAFYDVGKRASETQGIHGLPTNLARLEPRMNKGAAVSKYLKVGTLRDLAQLQDADLATAYAEAVNAEVFRLMPATAEASSGQLWIPYAQGVHELDVFIAEYGQRTFGKAFTYYVRALGVDALLARFGSFDGIRNLILDHYGVPRQTAWRIVRDLERAYKLMPTAASKGRNAASYLHELHEVFTAAAA